MMLMKKRTTVAVPAVVVCCLLFLIVFSPLTHQTTNRAASEPVPLPVALVDQPAMLPNWSDGDYHDYEGTLAYLSWLNSTFPGQIEVFGIGASVLGKTMPCVRVTTEANSSKKEAALIDGCIHGNEWEGGEACLYLATYLAMNAGTNATISRILNTTVVYIVPLVNPDGRDRDDRFNADGVDLNRNYDVNFGRFLGRNYKHGTVLGRTFSWIGFPKTHFFWTYCGPEPFSEPESSAIRDFATQLSSKNLSLYISCHTAQHSIGAPSYVVRRSDYTVTDKEIGVFEAAKNWVAKNTEYHNAPHKDVHGIGDSMSWCYKQFHIPSFIFEMMSKNLDPWFGHGIHDHLLFWMQTTIPVFMYLLVNIQNFHDWRQPSIGLPQGMIVPTNK